MADIIGFPETAAIHGEAVAGDAYVLRQELEALLTNLERSKLDIAIYLYKIKSEKYYNGYGFDTFKEYTRSIGIKDSKADYLPNIIEVMLEVECERKEYEPLGIAKLREITSLDPKGNYLDPVTKSLIPMRNFILQFVDEGTKMTLKEIQQHVRTLKGLIGDDELVYETLCFKKSVRDNVWKKAIEAARMIIGAIGRDENGDAVMASNGRCAEVIAAAYLLDPVNVVAYETSPEATKEETTE
jgi:hypothetical protein